jgi:hypothetical protein
MVTWLQIFNLCADKHMMAEHTTGKSATVAGESGFVGSHCARLPANEGRKARRALPWNSRPTAETVRYPVDWYAKNR